MKEYIQAVVTLLALINPVVCASIFTNCIRNVPQDKRTREAAKAVISVGAVLLASAFFGIKILHAFGISISAFTCAGGVILAWIGAGMLRPGDANNENAQLGNDGDASLSPLILFAASPGTITAVITLATAHTKTAFPTTAVVGVIISISILAAALLMSAWLSKSPCGKSEFRKVSSSYMGVIVMAMGMQFMLNGIQDFIK